MADVIQASVGKQVQLVHSTGTTVGPCVVALPKQGNGRFAFKSDDGHHRVRKDGAVDFRGGTPSTARAPSRTCRTPALAFGVASPASWSSAPPLSAQRVQGLARAPGSLLT